MENTGYMDKITAFKVFLAESLPLLHPSLYSFEQSYKLDPDILLLLRPKQQQFKLILFLELPQVSSASLLTFFALNSGLKGGVVVPFAYSPSEFKLEYQSTFSYELLKDRFQEYLLLLERDFELLELCQRKLQELFSKQESSTLFNEHLLKATLDGLGLDENQTTDS